NVIRVLEEIEDERIGELDFIELNACSGGCVGGVLCVENPYVAIARLQRLRKYLPVSQNHLEKNKTVPEEMNWGSGLEFSNVLTLSEDISRAMEMMMEIDKVEAELPGLDCGACGAPSCRAFAEDTVRGSCRKEDCVFILRKEIRRFADSLSNLDLDGGKRTNDDE
ncbi:(Fe-S)-binding protein, partial [Hominenteromicrobium sp.]